VSQPVERTSESPAPQHLALVRDDFGEQSQCIKILNDVGGFVRDEHEVVRLQREVHISVWERGKRIAAVLLSSVASRAAPPPPLPFAQTCTLKRLSACTPDLVGLKKRVLLARLAPNKLRKCSQQTLHGNEAF
jgi:hypothetical protein